MGRTTTLHVGRGIRRHVDEHVHRTLAELLARLDVGELLARHVHRDERIEVEIGVDADGVRLLFGDAGLGADRDRSAEAECRQSSTKQQSTSVHEGFLAK